METERFIGLLRADLAGMSDAARSTGMGADVPTCPGWDVRELVIHTGVVHRHKITTLLGDHADGPAPMPGMPDEAATDAEVLAWFDEGGALLLNACISADLSEPSWTWCPHEHTKAWWVRRMAHETVIHRIDAEIACGAAPTIDPWLALDGVDEIIAEFMVGGPEWSTVTPTDRATRLVSDGRSWTLRTAVLSGTSPRSGKTYDALDTLVLDPDAEPMATVTADPGAMDLWLWGRGELPEGAVTGDPAMADLIRQRAAEATG